MTKQKPKYNKFHSRDLISMGKSEFTMIESSDYKRDYKTHIYKSTRVNIMDVNLSTVEKRITNFSKFKTLEITAKTNKGVTIRITLFS